MGSEGIIRAAMNLHHQAHCILEILESQPFFFLEMILCFVDLIIVLIDIQLEIIINERLVQCFKEKLLICSAIAEPELENRCEHIVNPLKICESILLCFSISLFS